MNTADQVTIYNQALAAIGNSRYIDAVDEDSNEANTCNLFWETSRDQVLQDFDWDFARKYAELTLVDGVSVPGWLYCYAYPSDCLQARVIMPTFAEKNLCPILYKRFLQEHKIPYQIAYIDSHQVVIATNIETPTLAYTAQVTNVAQWSAKAINALVYYLAAKIAAPLSAAPEYAAIVGNAYKDAVIDAGAANQNEEREFKEPESEFERARR